MQTRRPLPPAAWPTALSTVACAVLGLWLMFGWGGPSVVRLVDSVGLAVFAVFAAVCAVTAARSAHGRQRKTWAIMAAGLTAWAGGELTWAFYEVGLGRSPYPSPADVLYVAASLLILTAMVQFPRAQSAHSRLRNFVDALIVAVALLALMWVLLLDGLYEANRGDAIALTLALLYPLLDIAMIVVAVLNASASRRGQRIVLLLLAAAAALMALSDMVFAYLNATDDYATGALVDVGWAVSLTLFGAAALFSRKPASTPPLGRDDVPTWASVWVPYAPLLIAGTVGPAAVLTGPLQIGVPILMALVVVRQSLSAWQNKRLLEAAAEQALRDPLTGLANGALFFDRLTHAMALRGRDARSVAVVSLDIDDFKLVNDTLGHHAADSLLAATGERIAECIRPGDTAARIDGDAFALLLEDRTENSHAIAARRLLDAFRRPFVVDGQDMFIHPSIGTAVASPTEPDVDAALLFRRADSAMRTAKHSRSAQVCVFDTATMTSPRESPERLAAAPVPRPSEGAARIRLLGELRQDIDRRALQVVYQPKIDLDTGHLAGVEALLRWPHAHLGTLHPDTFLPLVRQHGLMRPVTDLVIAQSLDDVARWARQGIRLPVAINLFAPSLRDTTLPDTLCAALQQRGLTPELLTVEITEDLVLSEVSTVTTVLQRLRQLGIRIAIDDFGSGYSALSYLRDLPIDEIKLDRHFIAHVTTNPKAAAVVEAVINLTHTLDVTVVAEGVEDAETAAWLTDHRCDVAQGYLYGRPTTADDIPGFIDMQSATHIAVQSSS